MTHLLTPERNASIRSAVASVLCLALIGVGIPIGSSASMTALGAVEVPPSLYVEIGQELFYVDFSSFLENYSEAAQGSGSFTVSVKKAVLPDSRGGAAFVLGETPSAADVRILGPDLSEAAMLTGTDPQQVQAWSELISWTMFRTLGFTRTSFTVGADSLSMLVPQSVMDGKPRQGDTIDLELNGFVVPLEPNRFDAFLPGPGGVPALDAEELLSPLVEQFVDSGAFLNSYVGFALIAERIFSTYNNQNGCAAACMGCAGSMLLSVASFLAIVGACGAAVGTAGAMALACAAAVFGHIGSNAVMLSSCASCGDCVSPGPPGGGGGGGGNDPSGECPAGYHDCCNNSCCSDENPPAGCNQV